MKTRSDKDMIDHIGVLSTLKPKLNYQDLSDRVLFVMKTRLDNELSWPIGLSADCDKNQIG